MCKSKLAEKSQLRYLYANIAPINEIKSTYNVKFTLLEHMTWALFDPRRNKHLNLAAAFLLKSYFIYATHGA